MAECNNYFKNNFIRLVNEHNTRKFSLLTKCACVTLNLSYPANINWFKVNKKRGEICSKLTIKTLERRQQGHSTVSTVNFEHISHLFSVFIVDFE